MLHWFNYLYTADNVNNAVGIVVCCLCYSNYKRTLFY